MRKLYITHKPGELTMAVVQVECAIGAAWMFWCIDSLLVRWVMAHAVVFCVVMVYQFLFTMSGSRERETQAAPTKEAAHG